MQLKTVILIFVYIMKKKKIITQIREFFLYKVFLIVKNTCNESRWDCFVYLIQISLHGEGKVEVIVDKVSHGQARQCIGNEYLFYFFGAEI